LPERSFWPAAAKLRDFRVGNRLTGQGPLWVVSGHSRNVVEPISDHPVKHVLEQLPWNMSDIRQRLYRREASERLLVTTLSRVYKERDRKQNRTAGAVLRTSIAALSLQAVSLSLRLVQGDLT